MTNTFYGNCERCGQPVTDTHGPPAFPVTGWEVQRDGGGANHIRNRARVPDRVRHLHCLPKATEVEGQQALL